MRFITYAMYHMRLELSFLSDEFACLPLAAPDSPYESTQPGLATSRSGESTIESSTERRSETAGEHSILEITEELLELDRTCEKAFISGQMETNETEQEEDNDSVDEIHPSSGGGGAGGEVMNVRNYSAVFIDEKSNGDILSDLITNPVDLNHSKVINLNCDQSDSTTRLLSDQSRVTCLNSDEPVGVNVATFQSTGVSVVVVSSVDDGEPSSLDFTAALAATLPEDVPDISRLSTEGSVDNMSSNNEAELLGASTQHVSLSPLATSHLNKLSREDSTGNLTLKLMDGGKCFLNLLHYYNFNLLS